MCVCVYNVKGVCNTLRDCRLKFSHRHRFLGSRWSTVIGSETTGSPSMQFQQTLVLAVQPAGGAVASEDFPTDWHIGPHDWTTRMIDSTFEKDGLFHASKRETNEETRVL